MLNSNTQFTPSYTPYPTPSPRVHSCEQSKSQTSSLRTFRQDRTFPSSQASTHRIHQHHDDSSRLCIGDFEEIYGVEPDPNANEGDHEPQAGEWDAVLTCFFIDTAKNIIGYLKTIHKILAPGGVWINLGASLTVVKRRAGSSANACGE